MPINNQPELILLDTHIWMWLTDGVPKFISPQLRELIEKFRADSAVRVSSISVWEVGMLVLKNRVAFVNGVEEWVYRASHAPGIRMEAITTEIALESTLLKDYHGDPADRILMATAKNTGATLITQDKEILSYSKKHGLAALNI